MQQQQQQQMQSGHQLSKMATIVRVKRRRDEDPLEVLLLSQKKLKTEDEDHKKDVETSSENVLKFAGTVYTKDASISEPVKDAIRKEKIERAYKQHQVNIVDQLKQKGRRSQKQNSRQNRYLVTAKHRAIQLSLLDNPQLKDSLISNADIKPADIAGKTEVNELSVHKDGNRDIGTNQGNGASINEETPLDRCQKKDGILCSCSCEKAEVVSQLQVRETHKRIEDNRGACSTKQMTNCKHIQQEGLNFSSKKKLANEYDTESGGENLRKKTKDSTDVSWSDVKGSDDKDLKEKSKDTDITQDADGERIYCLVDMEADTPAVSYDSLCAESNQIMCNGVPLEKELISERGSDDQYVYDLYYTNSRDFDFRLLENVLTVEAFGHDAVRNTDDDDDDRYGDYEDEDSNDEGNWRNDYPEEDPGFIDNQGIGYYGNDLDENLAFETETGDQLADWMSWRCNIENDVELSSEDDVEEYESGGKSYEAYYRRVRKEMEGATSSDENDFHS